MTEHCCGPTPAQARDANSRGEVLGTWERCPECSERERLLWERIGPHVFIVPPEDRSTPDFKPLVTVADIVGSDPDFAGDLSAEDYVRKLRD